MWKRDIDAMRGNKKPSELFGKSTPLPDQPHPPFTPSLLDNKHTINAM